MRKYIVALLLVASAAWAEAAPPKAMRTVITLYENPDYPSIGPACFASTTVRKIKSKRKDTVTWAVKNDDANDGAPCPYFKDVDITLDFQGKTAVTLTYQGRKIKGDVVGKDGLYKYLVIAAYNSKKATAEDPEIDISGDGGILVPPAQGQGRGR